VTLDEGRSRHCYVDIPNPEDSNYGVDEQHVAIDPAFLAQLQEESGGDINKFLALPKLISAKKRTRQQPVLDYTQSRILISRDYIAGLHQVLAQKEAIAVVAKRKKEEKEANKEQRKIEKEQLQKQKEERAEARAKKRGAKDLERQQKVAAAGVKGRRWRGAAAQGQEAALAGAGEGLHAGASSACRQ
jgi:phage protein D